MSQPVFHRLHPGTILISMVQAVRNMIVPIFFVAFSCIRGKSDGNAFGELFGAGLGLLVGAFAVFRYYNYGYAIHEGNLIIRDGWLTKKIRTIPLNRIQNINLKRGLIHQILHLVDMEIETAGGSTAEASLSALSEDSAQRLKVLLTGEGHLAMNPMMSERQDPLIYAASPRELFLAGATQNRALTIFAGIFGTFYIVIQDQIQQGIEALSKSSNVVAQMNWLTRGILAVVILLVVGWIASIFMSFFTYWGFELRRAEDKLKRNYGLVNRIENVILINRIQVVRLVETMIQRWLKLCSMHVDTAGGMASPSNNKEHQRQAANPNTNLISPLLESSRIASLLHVVLPGLDIDTPSWEPVSPRSITRRVRLGLLINIIWSVMATVAIEFGRVNNAERKIFFSTISAHPADVAMLAGGLYVAFCLLTWARAVLYYRTARWWDQGDVFVSQTGVLSRNTWYAPIAKIQSIQIAQSPGQRRLGLASLTFRTAAMHGSAAVEVQDLPTEMADRIVESLHQRSAVHAWVNPDGF
jgi:putative membrane protein